MIRQLLIKMADAIDNLAGANYMTGHFDQLSHQKIQSKPLSEFTQDDFMSLHYSMSNARINVERRAKERNIIEECYTQIVEAYDEKRQKSI
jgi:hypothetical protein